MAKLAEGTGLQLPPAAVNALHMPVQPMQPATPAIATQCFLLSNMFDPSAEQAPNWTDEIRDDVIQVIQQTFSNRIAGKILVSYASP